MFQAALPFHAEPTNASEPRSTKSMMETGHELFRARSSSRRDPRPAQTTRRPPRRSNQRNPQPQCRARRDNGSSEDSRAAEEKVRVGPMTGQSPLPMVWILISVGICFVIFGLIEIYLALNRP